jgi:predicted dehydrogenase
MTLEVAITGAGYIAAIHAKAVKAQEDSELVAVVEKFSDKSVAFAQKFRIKNQYTSIDDLIKDAIADVVIIGTPNFLHTPQAIAAKNAGLNVMVEKPMAMNANDAEHMLTTSMKKRKTLMIAHCWRFDRDVLWLRSKAPKLGQITRTKRYGVYTHWGPVGWFTQKQYAGGGALADMGIHALDTTRFLLGDPLPASVFAHIGTYYTDFDVDDTGAIIVTWGNCTISYIESGWWQPHSDVPEASTQLYGSSGFGQLFPTRLEIPVMHKQKVKVIKSGFKLPRKEHCPQSMYNSQMAYFFQCIREGKTPIPGGQEGLVNMKVVDAAYESAKTGSVVEIKQ